MTYSLVPHFNKPAAECLAGGWAKATVKTELSTLAEKQTTHRIKLHHNTKCWDKSIHSAFQSHWLYSDAVCDLFSLFLCLLVKTSSLFDHTNKVAENNGALSEPRYWLTMEELSFLSLWSHTAVFPPLRTQSNLCHSVAQTNKRCLCFSFTPLLFLPEVFSSLAQMLFCSAPHQTAFFSHFQQLYTHVCSCFSFLKTKTLHTEALCPVNTDVNLLCYPTLVLFRLHSSQVYNPHFASGSDGLKSWLWAI